MFRVVALPSPTDREQTQMYVQRYVPHLPAGGEVVIFDRSWYNRAGVERVMGFCTEEQTTRFLELAPGFEKAMVDSGILLLKYWLEVGSDEQTRRLQSRIDDPRKIVEAVGHGPEVVQPVVRLRTGARRDVRRPPARSGHRGTSLGPTTRSAAASTSSRTCSARFPTRRLRPKAVKLPARQKAGDYVEPDLGPREIPTPF